MEREPTSSRKSSQGERKQVTVLFADVAGFTSLSGQLDPEEVHDLLRPALDIMAEEIHAYEGTVAQFMGDGLMALFGAPLAHEDDPQRAVYAALAVQRRLVEYREELKPRGVELSMRIGINTGLVMVGSVGDDLAMEYTALGDTVNLASRMESAAEPGTVQVSESTHQLAQGYFEFHDLGEIEVKGKEEPVHAWRVLGELPAHTRISASLSSGLSPFIGREWELDNLTRSYQQAKTGQGQVVALIGEPGVGKSRLLLEFRESLSKDEYTYLEGGCIHYGEAIAYLPIQRLLRNYFDITEGEEEAESKRKMEERLAFLDGQLAHVLSPLQELLSLSVDDDAYLSLEPAQRRDRVFEAVRYLFVAESQQRPLVLAIEDLHWMDRTSEEFLSSFIEGLPASSVLLILLYRPEYTPTWVSKTYYRQILVDLLPQQTSSELVEAILCEGEVSDEISDFIVGRSAGNPLFIEELTRGLLEADSIVKDNEHYVLAASTSDIQVPETIHGIIASRLDRLPEELKEIVQVASVIGREFSLRLLQEVTALGKPLKSCLLELQSLEFIYEKMLFPEPEYIFKHALTQEVAYESLLLKSRREMHDRLGQAIEQLYPESLEDHYETLAYHYLRSYDAEKAINYLKLSGDKAARNFANWEAINFYEEAIQVLEEQPQSEENKNERMAIFISIQNSLVLLSFPEGSLELLQKAEELANELGDDAILTSLYSKFSLYYSLAGNLSLSMEYSEKCYALAEKLGDVDSMGMTALDIGPGMCITGRFIELATISRRVIELLEEQHREKELFAGGLNIYINQYGYYAFCVGFMGELEEARAAFKKGLDFAIVVDDIFGMGWMEYYRSYVSCLEGCGESLVDSSRNAIDNFERTGVELVRGIVWATLGVGYSFLGKDEDARECTEKGLKFQEQCGVPGVTPMVHNLLSLARLAAGDLSGAMESADEALRLSRASQAKALEALALMMLGRTEGKLYPSRLDAAEKHIKLGLSMCEEMNSKLAYPQGCLFLGEVYEIADRREEALENLRRAEGLYLDIGVCPDSYWLTRTRKAISRLEPVS